MVIDNIKVLVEEIRYERKVLEAMAKKEKTDAEKRLDDAKSALAIFKEVAPISPTVAEELQIGGSLLAGRTDAGWLLPTKAADFDANNPVSSNMAIRKRGNKDANGFYITTTGKVVRVYTEKGKKSGYYNRYGSIKHQEELPANLKTLPDIAAQALPVVAKALLEKYKEWLIAQTSGNEIVEEDGELVLTEGNSKSTNGRRLAF